MSSRLQPHFNKIKERLPEINNHANSIKDGVNTLFESGERILTETYRLGGVDGEVLSCSMEGRLALIELIEIGHDIELSIREDIILDRSGINLAQLFNKITFDIGFGIKYSIEQNGIAKTIHKSNDSCSVVPLGRMALEIPLLIVTPSGAIESILTVTLGLIKEQFINTFKRFIVRGAHFCSEGDVLPIAVKNEIKKNIDSSLDRLKGVVPFPTIPNLPFGNPDFYIGTFGKNVSMYGTINKRPRIRLPKLDNIEPWADSALKISISSINNYITKLIKKYGAKSSGGLSYSGNNDFRIQARIEKDYTKKIGCVRYGIEVKVSVILKISFSVIDRTIPVLNVAVREIDKNVDVDVHPKVINWVLEQYLEVGSNLLIDFLDKISQDIELPVRGAKKAKVFTDQNQIAIHMKTREILI